MRIATVLACAFALAACSADPADAWVGSYRGTLVSAAVDCDTGAPLDTLTDTIEVTIVRYHGGLAINGECPIPLELTGDTSARVAPGTCEGTLDDGTPVRYERLNGQAVLDGDELSFSASTRVYIGGSSGTCDSAMDDFVGNRL